jgi:hypothetical protein
MLRDDSVDEVGPNLSRIARVVIVGALAFTVSGCWAMAIQYAPAALQTAVAVASNAVGAAQSTTFEAPGVIELRTATTGAPEYRELRVDVAVNEPRWTPVVDRDTAADGWRPAENFMQMNFTPPLPTAFSESKIVYLAYAPADTGVPADHEQLAKFNQSFGTPVGTFDWNGRTYQYSLPKVLPPLELD